jgi:hypothetical protein
MARRGRPSSARCAQNLPCRIRCRRGADRSSNRADPGAGCRAGRRPCVDRTYPPNIGCCRLRDRRRAILPDRRVGICLFVEIVVAAKPLRMIPRLRPLRKLLIPWGSERYEATARRGCKRIARTVSLPLPYRHRVPSKSDGCSSVACSHRIERGWMHLGSWGWRERRLPPFDPLSLGYERHPARLNAPDRPA